MKSKKIKPVIVYEEKTETFDRAMKALDFIDALSNKKPSRSGHLHARPVDGGYVWEVSWKEPATAKLS